MSRRTYIILALVAVALFIATRRSLWVAAIKRKWTPRYRFVAEYQPSFWDTFSFGELVSTYFSGLPSWADEVPGTGSGTFTP